MKKKSHYSDEKRKLNKDNRELTLPEVLEALTQELKNHCKIVGKWIWATFPEKPDADTCDYLYCLGFIFNPKRQAWQHCCGDQSRARARNYDPRQKYGEKEVETIQPATN